MMFGQTFPHCRRRGEPRLDTKAGDDELKMRITEVSYTWPRDIEVDSNLKDLVDRMLKKVPGERYGMTKIAEPSSANEKTRATQGTSTQLDWKNQQIRQHPFMLFFPWNLLSDRKCIVSFIFSVPKFASIDFGYLRRLPTYLEKNQT